MQFHHIGIVVKNLEYGKSEIVKFVDIVSISDEVIDQEIGVKILFITDSKNIVYELIEPYGRHSPVDGVLSRKKDYLNHIAYSTNFFDNEVVRLRTEGMIPLGPPKAAKAFNGSKVIFFLTPLGFIIELIENVIKK